MSAEQNQPQQPHTTEQVPSSAMPDPTEGILLPPLEVDQRIPMGANDRLMYYMYSEVLSEGSLSRTDAQEAVNDSIDIVRSMDDAALLAVNRDVSDLLERMETESPPPDVDPKAVRANLDPLVAAYKIGDTGALEDIRRMMGVPDHLDWNIALQNVERALSSDDPEDRLDMPDDQELTEALFMVDTNSDAFAERYDEVIAAHASISLALESLSYIDDARAVVVYEQALSDDDLNTNGLEGIARGIAGFSLIKGKESLPLWQTAYASAVGDQQKLDVLNLVTWGVVSTLEQEISSAKHDPEADIATIKADKELVAGLKKLIRTDQEAEAPPDSADMLEHSKEQRRETLKRFEKIFNRKNLKGDGRWN